MAGTVTAKCTGARKFCASLKFRAREAIAIIRPENSAAAQASATMPRATAPQGMASSRSPTPKLPPRAATAERATHRMVMLTKRTLSRPVRKEIVATARYLPKTMERRGSGVARRASRVPRSFSPAARSMAG
jgi:hypothetical protein